MHNNIPEGPPYPIRSVTDGEYHYIRNLTPEAIYIEKHLMGQNQWHTYWPTWVFSSTFSPYNNWRVTRYMRRRPEQLYNTLEKPYEMDNQAHRRDLADVKQRLSTELDRWMAEQGDPGAAIDTPEQWEAARKGNHFPLPEK